MQLYIFCFVIFTCKCMGRGNVKNQLRQIFGIIKVNLKEDLKKLHNEEPNLCHVSNIIVMKI